MLRRTASVFFLVWLFGFIWFAVSLPQPIRGGKTDGVIVVTGGSGRIDRGIEALQKGWAGKMLVAGVDREVRPREFQVEYNVPTDLMECCITLGFESVDTRSNAREAAGWIEGNNIRSFRLVTTDWHMRRASFELIRKIPGNVAVIKDPIPSEPSLGTLFLEYHKLLARVLYSLWAG